VHAADDGVHAGDKVVRDEGDTDVVVGAPLERVELSPQVTAPGERDGGHPLARADLIDELHGSARFEVDLHDHQMWPPGLDRRAALAHGGNGPPLVSSMKQRELDHLRQRLCADDQEDADIRLAPRCPGATSARRPARARPFARTHGH